MRADFSGVPDAVQKLVPVGRPAGWPAWPGRPAPPLERKIGTSIQLLYYTAVFISFVFVFLKIVMLKDTRFLVTDFNEKYRAW